MKQRFPAPREFANSTAKLSVVYRTKSGQKQFEISRAAAGAIIAGAALTVTVALSASLYVVSKDSLMRTVLNGQARMQYAYEDRIAQLRAHLDRVAGRQLIDQDTVESRLQALLSRQVQLENRQAMIARVAEDAGRAGVRVAAPARAVNNADPVHTGALPAMARDLPGRELPSAANGFVSPQPKPMPDGVTSLRPEPLETTRTDRLSELSLPITRQALPVLLDRAEIVASATAAEQVATLKSIEMHAQASATRFRAIMDHTGLDKARFAKAIGASGKDVAGKEISGIGGPLLPMTGSEAVVFERSLAATQRHLKESEGLARVVRALPIRRPLPKSYETSSTFGGRVDPFTRGYAMHSGLDFRASSGTPVKVTADGKVIQADWVGGYGRLVEVDHGFGLTTRYAHLSGFEVGVGDTLRKGATVGYVGSTGRSTGPHLHYEIRIDDDAVDPLNFVRSGEKSGID